MNILHTNMTHQGAIQNKKEAQQGLAVAAQWLVLKRGPWEEAST